MPKKAVTEPSKPRSRDEVVQTLFALNAAENIGGHGVCQIRQDTVLYDVCGACVLMRACPDEYMSAPEGIPFNAEYTQLPCFNIAEVSAVYPENALAPWRMELTKRQVACLFDPYMYLLPMCSDNGIINEPGIELVENDVLDHTRFLLRGNLPISGSKGNTDWAKHLKRSFHCLPLFTRTLDDSFRAQAMTLSAKLTVSTRARLLTIVFTGDDVMLYMSMAKVIARNFGDAPKLMQKQDVWALSGWEDSTHSYAELRKGVIMKDPELTVPPTKERATIFDTLNTQEEKPQEPEVEVKATEVAVQAAEEEKPAQKRTRTRKAPTEAKKGSFDEIIAALSAPVQDLSTDQVAAAVEELRGIRDLQMAATRRMANLALAIHKTMETSLAVLNEMRTILVGK